MTFIKRHYIGLIFVLAAFLIWIQFHQSLQTCLIYLGRLLVYGFFLWLALVLITGSQWKRPGAILLRKVIFTIYALGFAAYPYAQDLLEKRQEGQKQCFYVSGEEAHNISVHHCRMQSSSAGYFDLVCSITNQSPYNIVQIEMLMAFKDVQGAIIHQEPIRRSETIETGRTKIISTSFSVAHLPKRYSWEILAKRFRMKSARGIHQEEVSRELSTCP